MDIVFFNEEHSLTTNYYVSDVQVNASEMTIYQIIQESRGPVEWSGRFPYVAKFRPGIDGSRNLAYPGYGFQVGKPLKYYHTLGEQNVEAAFDGKVYIMLRTVNPETIVVNDSLIYENRGFYPLP